MNERGTITSTDDNWVVTTVQTSCAYFACGPSMAYEEYVAIDFSKLPVKVCVEEGSFAAFAELWCQFKKGTGIIRRYEIAEQVAETIKAHRRSTST